MEQLFQQLRDCSGFIWDAGNRSKNVGKHGVSCSEAEEVFFRHPLFLLEDTQHSHRENRVHAFGTTGIGRPLAVTFTIRNQTIRIISARDQNRKELKSYGFQR
jgi:uncharacterized DUF497 family protein